MSGRAAARLDGLGFRSVFRYTPGKMDWAANGLPTEGHLARYPRLGRVARADVPTCRVDERIGDVRDRRASWPITVVVDDHAVVVGVLRHDPHDVDRFARVEQAMRPGPITLRPNIPLATAAEYLRRMGLDPALVTTSDGVLLGAARREDVERLATETVARTGGKP